jgi:Tfp pilus assembly protein PilV
MKTLIGMAAVLLTAGTLAAQNMHMAIDQAKRASSQNDAEQQRIANAAGGTGAGGGSAKSAAAGHADPALQATLSNINSLQADFAAIITVGSSNATVKTDLLNNLTHAAQSTKATADSVRKVSADLLTALAGQKKLVAAQQKKLAVGIHAIFNSSHLSATQQETLLADIQKIMTDAGVSLDDAVDAVTDLKAVAAETK